MNTSYVFFADGFEEIEALTTVDIMRRAGMQVVTVSINPTLEATGAHGVVVKADALIADVDLTSAEWLICPGGMPGASNLAACKPLTDALLAQHAKGGKIAAICASPSVIFGPLGLLEGRNAVCYPGMEDGMTGAIVGTESVAIDGNITTGNGPAAAAAFGLAIAHQSMGEEITHQVVKGMLLVRN
ncbi:MAG: DJ-1/PfpI family protein [Bacteroidales bacterium]|nr:DJ-1/PfpI family protein [Bacteroidales bacterium]